MNSSELSLQPFSRRRMLKTTSSGFGYLAFSALSSWAGRSVIAGPQAAVQTGPLAPKSGHFAARAKHVIFLCMQGGPSHVDMLDYKPKLFSDDGKEGPLARGRAGQIKLMASPWKFKQHGRSGQWISDLLPELAAHADELCIINSMSTDVPAHPQAFMQMHTGTTQFVRPSLGSWTLYGLGTDNENLPGFVTINPGPGSARTYGSAFLPAIYQGTKIGGRTLPGGPGGRFGGGMADASISNIKNPQYSTSAQRTQLDLVQALNQSRLQQDGGVSPEIEGVIESYELAFRMQAEAPKVMDLSSESEATRKLYGIGSQGGADTFGRQCLMARKLVEAGVRFVEITQGNWDQHRNLQADLERNCNSIDQPISGLLIDLKQRGLLKDTLVIWGGEFGRTPHAQFGDGRDHNNKGFTIWMAGGGVKGGLTYGKTDDYGYEAVENVMHIHDWHATVLHLMGLDHEKLTYRYAGRDFRLTDVYGTVAKDIIA